MHNQLTGEFDLLWEEHTTKCSQISLRDWEQWRKCIALHDSPCFLIFSKQNEVNHLIFQPECPVYLYPICLISWGGRSWVGDHIFKGMGMGFNKKPRVSAIMGMVIHQYLMGDAEGDNWLICRLHAQCIISNNNWRLLDEVEQNIVICQWRADRLSEAKNWSFSRKSYRKENSTVSFTHVQNIICSQTQLVVIAHEQTIICRQLFAGHVVGFWPMKRKKICIEW